MKLFKSLYISIVFIFLYLPIFILIAYSFNKSKYSVNIEELSLRWYEKLLENDDLIQAAIHSLQIAFLSATLATILGTLGAIALYRYRFFGRQVLQSGVYILIVAPEIVMGIALLMLFVLFGFELGFTSLLIAHITFCLPFVVVSVMSRLSTLDKNIIEAAYDLGASEFMIFYKVIFLNILPSVVAGFLLSFTLSLDDVIISFFVSGVEYEILPIKIFSMVKLGVTPEINALCTIMFSFTVVVVALSQFLIREKQ